METPPSPSDITIGCLGLQEGTALSVSLDDAVASTKLPYTTTDLEGICKKAGALVTEVHSVVPAPGFGLQDKMVKSKSGSTPHLVTVSMSKKGGQYKYDDKCP